MNNTIGLRRETVDDSERRAPLTPTQVRELIRGHGVRVIVEPSGQRIFSDDEYRAAGAEISSDLDPCNIVLGVKEIPVEHIRPGGVYCFFSHTVKAQRYNMPMLAHIVEVRATLIDYELVTSEAGRRLIYFGNYAGYAGMIDSLWALGKRLAWEGISNPFEEIRPAWQYERLADAEAVVAEAGERIREDGLPEAISPLVCVFTGRGRVSRGAQELFGFLPAVRVAPDKIAQLRERGAYSSHAVYGCELRKPDLYARCDGSGGFDADAFQADPSSWKGVLHEYVKAATLIINGIFWSPRYPRLLTREFMRALYADTADRTLRVIGDITCDIEGAIEFTVKATTSEDPVYVYEPLTGRVIDGWEGDGPVVLAVDRLPSELPREASQAFGEGLLPFVADLAGTDFTRPAGELELPAPFRKALIAHRGTLTENFRYLNNYLLRGDTE